MDAECKDFKVCLQFPSPTINFKNKKVKTHFKADVTDLQMNSLLLHFSANASFQFPHDLIISVQSDLRPFNDTCDGFKSASKESIFCSKC